MNHDAPTPSCSWLAADLDFADSLAADARREAQRNEATHRSSDRPVAWCPRLVDIEDEISAEDYR